MNDNRTKNLVSPVIFAAFGAMMVFIAYLLVRAFSGAGIFEPGKMSVPLLALLVLFFGGVWCTILFIGYQLRKIARDE
ncbi:MAG: hypothetical protein AAB038_04930 [Planctomycetota bacterium]